MFRLADGAGDASGTEDIDRSLLFPLLSSPDNKFGILSCFTLVLRDDSTFSGVTVPDVLADVLVFPLSKLENQFLCLFVSSFIFGLPIEPMDVFCPKVSSLFELLNGLLYSEVFLNFMSAIVPHHHFV